MPRLIDGDNLLGMGPAAPFRRGQAHLAREVGA
jgi:hypothetical protein